MRFDKIIIIGSNTVACNCLITLRKDISADKLMVIESSVNQWSMLKSLCGKWDVEYDCIVEKEAIGARLEQATASKRSLIISANNKYLFKKELVEKKDVEIINFHYSLLPVYRGLNIPSWVIYNGEKQTGITWHYVASSIDAGDILSQRVIDIKSTTTAADIIKTGMRIAGEAFKDFYPQLLDEHVKGKKIEAGELGKIYLARDIPGKGIVDVETDDIYAIDRMLRAYDTHCMEVIPRLRILYKEKIYFVDDYDVTENDGMQKELEYCGDSLVVTGGSKRISIKFVSTE